MPTDNEVSRKSGIQRATSILNLLTDIAPKPLGVSSIARELKLPKAVAYRILKEFVQERFLSFDINSKHYTLGPRSLVLGLAALRTLDIPATARPYMERLVGITGETATLSIRQGWNRVYIDQVVSTREVRMAVALGTRHPLYAGSSSKSILAAMHPDSVKDYLSHTELTPLTPTTIVNKEQLLVDLDQIRARGYAISEGEREVAARSVSAAIHDATDDVWGSISLCGPRDRFDTNSFDRLGPLIAEAARNISRDVGYVHEGSTGSTS